MRKLGVTEAALLAAHMLNATVVISSLTHPLLRAMTASMSSIDLVLLYTAANSFSCHKRLAQRSMEKTQANQLENTLPGCISIPVI